MKIGVVVVNWNSGAFLLECIRSILRQTRPPDRVLIIDNGSTDNSLSELGEVQLTNLEIIKLGRNRGFAYANNYAVSLLDDIDWVALLNPDAVADSKWLESLEEATRSYPNAWSFASRMNALDRAYEIDGAGDCYHVSGFAWRRYHGFLATPKPALENASVFGPCGGAAFYSRPKFVILGGFDEKFFCYCEDVDLAFRVQLAGGECWYVNDAVVFHKGGACAGGVKDIADYYGHRNIIWVWVKNMPPFFLITLTPIHIIGNIIILLYSVFQGRGPAVWRGKLDALKGLNEYWQVRRIIQRERNISLYNLWKSFNKSLWTRRK